MLPLLQSHKFGKTMNAERIEWRQFRVRAISEIAYFCSTVSTVTSHLVRWIRSIGVCSVHLLGTECRSLVFYCILQCCALHMN